MKIRIFALAKELDIDSKVLLQHCADAGLSVKASPLASISPEERDQLLAYLKQGDPVAEPADEVSPAEPVRAAPQDTAGKIRQIRTLGPLGDSLRSRRGQPEDEGDTEAPAVAEVESEEVEVVEPEIEPTAAPIEEEIVSEPAVDDEGDEEAADDDVKKPAAISRSDYVAPTGSGLSGIREMKPRGSVRESEAKPRRERPKKGPALPSVATPTFKGPSPEAKSDSPAQKPEVRLTADLLKQSSPLASILKKHKDDTKRPGGPGEETEAESRRAKPRSLGLAEGREERRRRRQRNRPLDDESEGGSLAKVSKRKRRSGPVTLKTEATITVPITIREFSEALGRPARDIQGILFRAGKAVTINDVLEEDEALEVALELGVDVTVEEPESVESRLQDRFDLNDDEIDAPLEPRTPVITILGHVDHGKTTLVDRIRSSNVVSGEAGGITQHIAAYQVEHDGRKLTFVDTPGHAAFGEMCARGANVTDIVVLVVAADDGVMPQTVECISHAKAAGVPVVVAMNKTDLPDIDEQRVLSGLSQHDVLPVEWGGDTEIVRVSALQGAGMDDLLETLVLTADLHELQAPVEIQAEGVCLEASRDEGLGPLAWLIIRRGTLRVGDVVCCGTAHGRIRAMYTDQNEEISEAGPSTPVRVAGLDLVPDAGDHFFVMDSLEEAREVTEFREHIGRTESLAVRGGPKTLEDYFEDGAVGTLNLVLKADTPGSIEALRGELEKLDHSEVRVQILHSGVGGVNESDVTLAASTGSIVIAFHVVPEERARALADQDGVQIRRYDIIYKLKDDIKQALEGLLKPERVEVSSGRAIVLRTFSISRFGMIAGCRVLAGTIERNNRVHVIRDQTVLNDYAIASLKREKDDAREVREGMECGIRLDGFNDIKEGDLLEAFRVEERKRTLDE